MSRWVIALAVALVLQCAAVALVYWPDRQDDTGAQARAALLDFDPDLVDEIYISDGEQNETTLLKVGERWMLPELEELPADGARISAMLRGLHPLDPGLPVADTPASRQRFQVADYHYQRRITLIGNGALIGTIYLGTSPGFRRVHARADGSEVIYSIAFSSFAAPGSGEEWLDRKLLQVKAPTSISSKLFDLHRRGDGWVTGLDTPPDEAELQALLDTLGNLQVMGLAGEDAQRELAVAKPELVLDIKSPGGEIQLALFTLASRHYIYSGRHRQFFRLGDWAYDRLLGIDPKRLVGAAAQGGGAAAGAAVEPEAATAGATTEAMSEGD